MWVNCLLRSGLLFVTLSLAIAKHKQSSFNKSCSSQGTLSQAVDTLYVKAARLKAAVPEDYIKNIRLLKKKTRKLFMKNCRFQEQLLSFFMEDVFGYLQLQACKEIHFVEDFHSLTQKLSNCNSCASSAREMKPITRMKRIFYGIGNKGIYKAIGELDILLSWIKKFLESIK
ncbi:interleukin-26 [Dasypus novemcinctus]|uniref:Interleukin family protein n=1 Tax=Dasypus novemcinctus TaxID=9361 RepID=A0A7R8C3J2_DASNO|nr:interleukin-26 [Dasypus novemcinctus]CAB0000538.1 TPA: interferon 2G [Dasypus novemcinctus]